MTATYTFDVFSPPDGYGSSGADGDWDAYWAKQGPELLDHRLALYRPPLMARLTPAMRCLRCE